MTGGQQAGDEWGSIPGRRCDGQMDMHDVGPYAIHRDYGEALAQARRINRPAGGMLAKVERSPYGKGFVVRNLPVTFWTSSHLTPLRRPVEWDGL